MLTIFLLMAQAPVVMSYQPPAAEGWHQSNRFRCLKTELRVEGVGFAKPTNGATIFVNGRPLKGKGVATLLSDLSRPAVYRLGVRCPRTGSTFVLFVDIGEKPARGDVIFERGVAYIKNSDLTLYRGLERTDSEDFWFR